MSLKPVWTQESVKEEKKERGKKGRRRPAVSTTLFLKLLLRILYRVGKNSFRDFVGRTIRDQKVWLKTYASLTLLLE